MPLATCRSSARLSAASEASLHSDSGLIDARRGHPGLAQLGSVVLHDRLTEMGATYTSVPVKEVRECTLVCSAAVLTWQSVEYHPESLESLPA